MTHGGTSPSRPQDGIARRPLALWHPPIAPRWVAEALRIAGSDVLAVGPAPIPARDGQGGDPVIHDDLRTLSGSTLDIPLLHCGTGTADEAAMLARPRPVLFVTEPWVALGPACDSSPESLLLPAFPLEGAFSGASEIIATHGAPSFAAIECVGAQGDGSILARIAEAAILACAWMGLPDRVFAVRAGRPVARLNDPRADSSSRAFRSWHGTMVVACQFDDGRAVSIVASCVRGAWSRRAVAEGPFGAIEVTDTRLAWAGIGAGIDGIAESHEAHGSIASVAAESLGGRGALDSTMPAHTFTRARAVAEAACLSALNGEPESPAAMAELLARSERQAS